MSSRETERRAPDAPRVPFDGMVEVGGAQGPSFEAQAMNVSIAGMALRAGYLPTLGQPLTCQFETDDGNSVLASGEVTWCKDGPEGGEFGLSFGKLDAPSASALKTLFAVEDEGQDAPAPKIPVGRVRLHIDGLGVPMKARVKDASIAKVTTYSELGYLQTGKELELEDAETGEKRPARIHKVQVETSAADVPQLVVTMRYEDESARAASAEGTSEDPPEAREGDESEPMKHDFADRAKGIGSQVGAGLLKIGPAIGGLFARAKTAAAMLAKKRKEKAASEEPVVRRTTAPPPGGRLQSSGRKVVRTEAKDELEEEEVPPKKLDKRKLAIGGAAGIALILGLMAMRKPHEPAPLVSAPPAEPAAAVAPIAPAPSAPAPSAAPAPAAPGAMAGNLGGPMGADDAVEQGPPGKKGKPKPFTNGPVAHGTVLKLKMDGPIERMQGAAQPTGFTIALPNRRSLEAASPLASKDSRIAGIRVANDGNGAELTLTFKDGVPNYIVRAKGDTLEMVIAKEKSTAEAKKKGSKGADKHHAPASKGHGKH